MEGKSTPQERLSYADLDRLAQALTTSVSGMLMSLEESRAIWKKHLVRIGWKQVSEPKEKTTQTGGEK